MESASTITRASVESISPLVCNDPDQIVDRMAFALLERINAIDRPRAPACWRESCSIGAVIGDHNDLEKRMRIVQFQTAFDRRWR